MATGGISLICIRRLVRLRISVPGGTPGEQVWTYSFKDNTGRVLARTGTQRLMDEDLPGGRGPGWCDVRGIGQFMKRWLLVSLPKKDVRKPSFNIQQDVPAHVYTTQSLTVHLKHPRKRSNHFHHTPGPLAWQ